MAARVRLLPFKSKVPPALMVSPLVVLPSGPEPLPEAMPNLTVPRLMTDVPLFVLAVFKTKVPVPICAFKLDVPAPI